MEAPITIKEVWSEIKEKKWKNSAVLIYTFHVLSGDCCMLAVKIIARNSHKIFIKIDFSKIELISSRGNQRLL